MEESGKKKIMLAFIVVCLVAAAMITILSNSGGKPTVDLKSPYPFLCLKCGAAFKVPREDYHAELAARGAYGDIQIDCPECGEEAAVLALECAECGNTFLKGPIDSEDYRDRCPECGYSKMQEKREGKSD